MAGVRSTFSDRFGPPKPFLLKSSPLMFLAFDRVPTMLAMRRGFVLSNFWSWSLYEKDSNACMEKVALGRSFSSKIFSACFRDSSWTNEFKAGGKLVRDAIVRNALSGRSLISWLLKHPPLWILTRNKNHIREASELKNVTKIGKSPSGGGGQQKTSKSPKFEIWTFGIGNLVIFSQV